MHFRIALRVKQMVRHSALLMANSCKCRREKRRECGVVPRELFPVYGEKGFGARCLAGWKTCEPRGNALNGGVKFRDTTNDGVTCEKHFSCGDDGSVD